MARSECGVKGIYRRCGFVASVPFLFQKQYLFFIITFSEDLYSLTKEFINKKEVAPLILRFLFELFEEEDNIM